MDGSQHLATKADEINDDVATDEDVLRQLETFVRKRLGPDMSIEGFTRVSTGRSRQNWLFDAVWTHEGATKREPLIVRRDPLGGLLETDRGTEFALLRALESAPIPTPQVRWLDAQGVELGRPCLVMVRMAGTCDYYALNADKPVEERVDLARRLCSLLADVHRVDWHGIGLPSTVADPGPMASLAALDAWEAILARDQLEPYPEMALCAQWLRSTAPRSPRTVLVHADFKVGNVLLDDDGEIVALLDWEIAHLGDPHEDLGWVTQPLRTKEHFIKGAWERAELLAHYEQVSGHTVDHQAVAWWNVLAAYKTAVMQTSGLRAFVEGRSDEHYQPSAPVLKALINAAMPSMLEASMPPLPVPSPTPAPSPNVRQPSLVTVTGDADAASANPTLAHIGQDSPLPIGDVSAFLQWDTARTLELVQQHHSGTTASSTTPGSTPATTVPPNGEGLITHDPLSANHQARQRLVELIRDLPVGQPGDSARDQIGSHLLRRVSANPALARRTS
jgi:aminoglycoside phosphotransferase (APT) family kinase protein